jgi:tetratricopeptide (TPR) repeat protein
MSDAEPKEGIRGTDSLLARVDRVCDTFEAAWQSGRRPQIEAYLGSAAGPERTKLLEELLRLELEYRCRSGENPPPEEYHQRFPADSDLIRAVFADEGRHGSKGSAGELVALGQDTPSSPGSKRNISTIPYGEAKSTVEDPALPDLAAFGELQEIDRGGIGVVYRGKDPQLPRDLAIKVLLPEWQDHPELVRRFTEEAKITGKLQHPGVVPVHSMGQMPDGRPYFTMKLIRGQTLAEILAERASPSQDLPRFLKIFEQVCQTLAYTHSQGIVHRDLKPGNIMVGAFGEVQVMDWGFAKLLGRPDTKEPVTADGESINTPLQQNTRAGQVMGTPAYMPPEQALGEVGQIDERCDVFSLGTILCEILTGKPPYSGSPQEILDKAKRGDLADAWHRLEECGADPEVIALARRCLNPSPDERPQNAGVVAEAVAAYQAGVQERLRTAELGRAAAQAKAGEERKRRRLTVVLAAAVVLIVLGSSGAALWYFDDQARQERDELLRQAEIARKLGIAEQDVRQNLNQAQKAHDKLLEELKKPGGVQSLLRSRWDLRLQSARDAWKLAKDRADNSEGNLNPELADLLKKLDGDLARDQRDHDLAWRLEKIRLDTAIIVEGKFNYALAEEKYPGFFAKAGLPIEPGRLKETARLIQQSVIKEQLLASLEHWLLNPKDRDLNGQLLRKRLWELISLVDPDPWVNKVRNVVVSKDLAAIEKLADQLHQEQGLLRQLSPSMLNFVSLSLPEAKRESWRRLGQSLHPADFWCNFGLANFLSEKKRPAEAIGYYYAALAIRPNTSAVYNNLGIALRDQKNLPAAIDAFKKALAIDDKLTGTWSNLGAALSEQRNWPAAIDAHKKALAIDDKVPGFWTNLGVALHDQKNLPAAIEAHKKALAIDNKYAKAWNNLGSALADQKNLPAAIEAHKKALAIDDKYAEAWYNLGNALRDQKNFPAAIDAFKKALAINDKLAEAWVGLGNVLRDQKNLPAAIDAYKKALGIDDKYAMAWNNLGNALRDQKNLPAAIDAYKKALAIDDKLAEAWNGLGTALHDQKNLTAAIDAYKKALAIDDKLAKAWYNLGNALRDPKNLTAAIDAYKKALAIDDKLAEAWNNLGVALAEQKNLPAASDAFKKALAIDDKYAAAWSNLGNALHDQKNLPAAIEAHKKALAIDDKNAKAWNGLGTALYDQKNLTAAIDAYKKALAIDDKLAAAWSNLGLALCEQKNFPAAIEAHKKALAIDKKFAMAWYNLGNALRDQKNLRAAIDAYQKALDIDDKDAMAWTNLGNVLRQQKNLPAAIDAYKKALAIDDKNAKVWHNLGIALHDQKDFPAAIDAYKKALAIDDKNAKAWHNLGNALYEQKDFPAAIEAYKKALAIDDKNAEAWSNLGNALRDQRNLPAAIDAFKKVINLFPDYAEAHCGLGLALKDQGDFAAGLKALQKGHELGQGQPRWLFPSAAWVKHCQQLVTLEQKLPAVLKGGPAEAGELLALADLCRRYKKRYRDSASLFGKAFAAEPKAAENLDRGYRYQAACAAALAAAGKGKDAANLDAKKKISLRQEALHWLQADLTARARFVEKNPFLAIRMVDDLRHWQKDPDLAVVRDDKELEKLTGEERAAWQKFWTQVGALSKQARTAFSQTEHQGQLSDKEREQSYPFKMTAGKTYIIDMSSAHFDTYLRLEDDEGKVLAENDDISSQNLNSRIIFNCKQDGNHRIVATSFQQAGRGAFVLIIREFPDKR